MSSGKSAENNVCPGPCTSMSDISAWTHFVDNVSCSDVLFTETPEMNTHHPCCWLDRWGGSYPQQISFGSMCIANPWFQGTVWASRCWSWNGGGFISLRSLISFNFCSKEFLKRELLRRFCCSRRERSYSSKSKLLALCLSQGYFGPFLSWCDFGADYKKESGLYGLGFLPCLCRFCGPGFISSPVSSMTNLKFPFFHLHL